MRDTKDLLQHLQARLTARTQHRDLDWAMAGITLIAPHVRRELDLLGRHVHAGGYDGELDD